MLPPLGTDCVYWLLLPPAGEEGVYEGIPDDFIEKKNAGPEEDIYGGAGDVVGGEGIYDNPHVVTGGSAPGSKDEGMAYSGDGIYDNPEAVMQDDPLYDNKEGVMTKPEERPGQFRRQPEFDHSIYAHSPRSTMKGEFVRMEETTRRKRQVSAATYIGSSM